MVFPMISQSQCGDQGETEGSREQDSYDRTKRGPGTGQMMFPIASCQMQCLIPIQKGTVKLIQWIVYLMNDVIVSK